MYKLLEYGPVSDLEMAHDQTSGEFLGVCCFKFDGELSISNKIANRLIANNQSVFIDAKKPFIQFDEKGLVKERIIHDIIKTKKEYYSVSKELRESPGTFRDLNKAAHGQDDKPGSHKEVKPGIVRRRMSLKSGKLPVFFEVLEPCIFISNHYISTRVKIMPIVTWFSKQTEAIFVCPRFFIIVFRDQWVARKCFKEKNNTQFGQNVVLMKLFLSGLTDIEANEAFEANEAVERESKLLRDQLKKKEQEKNARNLLPPAIPAEIKRSQPDYTDRPSSHLLMESQVSPHKSRIPITSTSSTTAEISVEEKSPSSNRFNPLPSSVLSLPRFKRKSTITTSSKLQLTPAASREKVSARPMNHGLNDDSSDEEDDDSESATQTPIYPQAASDTSESTAFGKPESFPLKEPEKSPKGSNEEEEPLISKLNKSKRRNLKEFLHYTSSEGESDDDDDLPVSRQHKKLKHNIDDTLKTPRQLKNKLKSAPTDSQITPEESPTNDALEEVKEDKHRQIFEKDGEILTNVLVPLISPEEESEDEKRKRPKLKKLEESSKTETIKSPKSEELDDKDVSENYDPEWDGMFEEHSISQEIMNPRLDWEPSKGRMEPVCMDDFSTLLDLDGFQSFVKDDEDFELLKQVLKGVESEDIGPVDFWCWNQKEMKSVNYGRESVGKPLLVENGIEETLRWSSKTGASRSDGFKRIADKDKAAYLPHRRKIHEPIDTIREEPDTSTASTAAAAAGGSNSRHNRASNRRLANDISLQKQMLSSETDILNFNQLKKRKKPVKFARSAIHNWGLYAIEPITANDMIIEYVGEVVRQKVAELREKKYLRSGIGSSYLFRIDEQTVIDATKLGGIARFINHSCTPSCTAKIIKVEGKKRIVIYALRDIQANEELTYDYKFEREVNDEERIPCLCGSSGCKGYLN